jgi:hypothetical protein
MVNPHRQDDPARSTYSSLASCVIDTVQYNGRAQPLPYTNFREAPIRIHNSQVLDILEPCPSQPQSSSTVYLSLDEIF